MAKHKILYSLLVTLLTSGACCLWAIRTEAAKAKTSSPTSSTTWVKISPEVKADKAGQPLKPAQASPAQKSASQTLFERRILPIFNSPTPSSCITCHLSGVDLKNYILPSHQKTFISLRDQGLIDLDKPTDSKILRLIAMGAEPKNNAKAYSQADVKADEKSGVAQDSAAKEGAALISNEMQKIEYEAFRDWIISSCQEPALRQAPKLKTNEFAQPKSPVEVIRHTRKDRLLESFTKHVWSQQARCATCHMPGGAENAKKVAESGEEMNWMRPEGAEATMRYIIEKNLIDTQQPERSLLLLKPLNEVRHGGGQKLVRGDMGYKAFRAWIEDYANIVNNRYRSAAELPVTASTVGSVKAAPASENGNGKDDGNNLRLFTTEIWLKLNNTPPEWGDRLLQVTLYAWDKEGNRWEATPIAVSDRQVWGKGNLWQHSLILLAREGSSQATAWTAGKATLTSGRYLVKVHVDRDKKLEKDWTALLGDEDYVGQAEIASRWPQGYGKMTVIEAPQVRR